MFDPTELGRRIKDRRKQQGLTQEQLGQAVCISVQAVSKWENGESMPNIGTFPALCKTLGASADALLGIEREIEAETLGVELARQVDRLDNREERHTALMAVMGYLTSSGDGPVNRDRNLSYQLSDRGLTSFSLWSSSGLVCFAGGEALEGDFPSADVMDILRTLLSHECLPIACLLLNGPEHFDALLEAELAESSEELADVMRELIQAGLLVQDRQGYRLEENYGLLLTGMIKALGFSSLREDVGRGIHVSHTTG